MSAAGKLLNVQHTTVSRRIAALEKVLKQKLFHYGNQRYVLTAAGEKLLPHAIKIEEQSLEAQRALLGAETQVAGPLKVTMPYDFFCRVVASEIPRFAETYPDIELEFLCSPSLLDLSSLEADIALTLLQATRQATSLGEKLLPCPMVFTVVLDFYAITLASHS